MSLYPIYNCDTLWSFICLVVVCCFKFATFGARPDSRCASYLFYIANIWQREAIVSSNINVCYLLKAKLYREIINYNTNSKDLKNELYESYYLNFISPIPRSLLEDIAQASIASNCVTQISRVSVRFAVTEHCRSFSSSSSHCFVVNHNHHRCTINISTL